MTEEKDNKQKIWRVHLFTSTNNILSIENEKCRGYCINKGIIGLGWSYADNLDKYEQKAKEEFGDKYKTHAIDNIINNIKCGNLVWTRDRNQYYIGKVIDDKAHIFSAKFSINNRNDLEQEFEDEVQAILESENYKPKDKKYIKDILEKREKTPTLYETIGIHRCVDKWYPCKDYEVPGKVINNFISGKTINSVDENLWKYCEFLYLKKVQEDPNTKKQDDQEIKNEDVMTFEDENERSTTLKNLLHYEDAEDLLGIWLQFQRDYIVFPSTNKQSTKDYEYVLKKRNGSKKAIIQCKTGYDDIDLEVFDKYKDEDEYEYDIYLFLFDGHLRRNEKSIRPYEENIIEITDYSTEYPEEERCQIYTISLEYLLAWAIDKEHKDHKELLTDRLKHYLDVTGY